MWKCPVCSRENLESVCPGCGFDNSCDYESYPTLALLSGKQQAVSARKKIQQVVSVLKKIQEKQKMDFLYCPQCGGRNFPLYLRGGTVFCASCGMEVGNEIFSQASEEPQEIFEVPQRYRQAAMHKIATMRDFRLYVCPEGTVTIYAKRPGSYVPSCEPIKTWRDIVSISSGDGYDVVGLRRDGTVVSVGPYSCDVEAWRNVVAVEACFGHAVGLRADGTVLTAGLLADKADQVRNWKRVVAVAIGSQGVVGLHEDGSVVSTYDSGPLKEINQWENIIAISVCYQRAVGLRRDGTVVVPRTHEKFFSETKNWRNIVAVSASANNIVGLCQDGTVVATGDNRTGQRNVGHWRDVVEVSSGSEWTVGLCKNGSIRVTF